LIGSIDKFWQTFLRSKKAIIILIIPTNLNIYVITPTVESLLKKEPYYSLKLFCFDYCN